MALRNGEGAYSGELEKAFTIKYYSSPTREIYSQVSNQWKFWGRPATFSAFLKLSPMHPRMQEISPDFDVAEAWLEICLKSWSLQQNVGDLATMLSLYLN